MFGLAQDLQFKAACTVLAVFLVERGAIPKSEQLYTLSVVLFGVMHELRAAQISSLQLEASTPIKDAATRCKTSAGG